MNVKERPQISTLGSFNNYVNQFFPYFDHLPLEWTIVDILHDTYPLLHMSQCGLSTSPHPALLAHVVIE